MKDACKFLQTWDIPAHCTNFSEFTVASKFVGTISPLVTVTVLIPSDRETKAGLRMDKLYIIDKEAVQIERSQAVHVSP